MVIGHIRNTRILKEFFSKRFYKFLAVGLSGTVIDFVLFYVLHFILSVSIIPANAISYGTGLTSSFFLNQKWTFSDSTHKSHKQLIFSLLLGYIGLIINTLLVWLLSFTIHAMLAKAVAVLVVVVYNYFTNKILVFRIK